jgi:hypothetical protein
VQLTSADQHRGLREDLRLESWPGRQTDNLVRRIKRLYGLVGSQKKPGKGLYTPEEVAIVEREVKLFLKASPSF